MTKSTQTVEPWLRGPIEGIHPALMPIAHSLLQVIEDLPGVVRELTSEQLWATPGGAASIGFHLKHMASSLDRLYTYARGEKLREVQFDVLRAEKEADNRTADELLMGILKSKKQFNNCVILRLKPCTTFAWSAVPDSPRINLLCSIMEQNTHSGIWGQ